MATRTTQRQAQVAAALTADDWDLWQISKIGSTCPLCSTYEGRVYSKSGTDPDYPPLTMAFGKMDPKGMNDLSNSYLNIHPNCLHSLVRYTTAGKTDEQIQRDKDFSSFEKRPANEDYRSKKQIEAYRQKEAERAAFRRDMKQFNKYKAALGNDFPKTFETFEKHKKAGDEVYKEWERKFRELNKKASDIVKVEATADIPKTRKKHKTENSSKNISNQQTQEPFVDVTQTLVTGEKHAADISILEKINVKGETYHVDGKNIIQDHDDHEKNIAKAISEQLGVQVGLRPRFAGGDLQHIHSADYSFGDKNVDLKTLDATAGKDVIYNAIHRKKEQASSFVIDYSKYIGGDASIMDQAERIFKRKGTRFVNELYLIKDYKIVKVLKRK